MNFGACALSFVPGLFYDRLGCIATMLLGAVPELRLASLAYLLWLLWLLTALSAVIWVISLVQPVEYAS